MPDRNAWNERVIAEFRANNGVVGEQFAGVSLLLLHTTGAKSGRERINPLAFFEDAEGVYVFASKGGAPTHPDWYLNLVADPRVSVERGADTYEAEAVVVEGDERDRVYAEQARRVPGFADYEHKTDRVIPVVELRPV